jgi:KaiC/GvpD/RAD55 family RecA-like ATPase
MEKVKMERVKTGIPGLDGIIGGGLPKGSTTLIVGGPGTGKTIFCSQFLWHGLVNNENCMFVTFEEKPEDIKSDVISFGWDFAEYEKKRKLIMGYRGPFKAEDLFFFEDQIRSRKVTRVALDSTSVLSLFYKDLYDVRTALYKLVSALKASRATSLLTAETTRDDQLSRFGVEEFVVDGLIVLFYASDGGYRGLQIRKMRRTYHSTELHPMEITKKGIVVRKG